MAVTEDPPGTPVAPGAGTVPDDTSRASPALHDSAQPRTSAFLPDREAVRQLVSAAIEESWFSGRGPASGRVMEAVWPLLERTLERARGAEAERDRSRDAAVGALAKAGAKIAEQRQRAEAAEGKLAEIEAVCLGVKATLHNPVMVAGRVLAIIGSEEENRRG